VLIECQEEREMDKENKTEERAIQEAGQLEEKR